MEQDIEAYRRRADHLYRIVRDYAYWASVIGMGLASLFAVTLIADHLLPSVSRSAVVVSHQCYELPYSRYRIGSDRVCDYVLRPDDLGEDSRMIKFRTDVFSPGYGVMSEVRVHVTPVLYLPYSMTLGGTVQMSANWGDQILKVLLRIGFVILLSSIRILAFVSRVRGKLGMPTSPEIASPRSLVVSLGTLVMLVSLAAGFPLYGEGKPLAPEYYIEPALSSATTARLATEPAIDPEALLFLSVPLTGSTASATN